MRDTILERRDFPRENLISRLWANEIDGQKPTIELIEYYAVLQFIAGLDTVMNGSALGPPSRAATQARLRAAPPH